MSLESLRFPVGRFQVPETFTADQLAQYRQQIADFPDQLRKAVEPMTATQIDTPYRPDGWTVRQVVHHCADSHMNAFIRFKLALTEEVPTIKPYFEDRWANLPDTLDLPVAVSLQLLDGLHQRWAKLLAGLSAGDLERSFYHPEMQQEVPLAVNMALYDWHCRHHLGHVRLVG